MTLLTNQYGQPTNDNQVKQLQALLLLLATFLVFCLNTVITYVLLYDMKLNEFSGEYFYDFVITVFRLDILTKVCNTNKNRLKTFHPAAYLNGHWLW